MTTVSPPIGGSPIPSLALNLGAEQVTVSGIEGSIALSTSRSRDGEHIGGGRVLAPGKGAIAATSQTSSPGGSERW